MSNKNPILVTGAAGSVGAVGRTIVELLLQRNLSVRALVHRHDEPSEALKVTGQPAMSIRDYVTRHLDVFREAAKVPVHH